MLRRRTLLAAAAVAWPVANAAAQPALGWFAWHARPWLEQPDAMLRRLPAPSDRLLLALDGSQLRWAATAEGAARVSALIAAARDAGVRVELLQGDPHWVLPGPRAQLMDLLAPLRALPFAGLNLDIERNQLPGMAPPAWRDGLLQTLREASAVTGWPLTLTTHADDMLEPAFLRDLSASGAAGAIAMAYVSFPLLARDRLLRILRSRDAASGTLAIGLAQSIEPELARGESWHRQGRAHALREWERLATGLRRHPGFSGLTVQSFEAFDAAPP